MKTFSANKEQQFLTKSSLLYLITGLFFFVFFNSCNNNTEDTAVLSDSKTTDTLSNKTAISEKKENYVLVKVDDLRVRDNPSTRGSSVVASLSENTYWKYTGTKSNQKEKITLRGQEFDTYWYLIDVGDCVSGWVYGGAVELVGKRNDIINKAPIIYFEPTLVEAYGNEKIKLVTKRIAAFDAIKNAAQLLDYYNTTGDIIVENLPGLDSKAYEGELDISSLGCALKVYSLKQLCSECPVELYSNSEQFLEKAKTTSEKIDDEIFQLMYDAVGRYNSFDVGNLSKHDCDFCWHSILGDGQILEFWKRVAKIWEWRLDHLSELKMEFIMRQIADYLLLEMESNTYMYSQEKVLAEYAEIVKVLKKVDWQKAKDVAFDTRKLRAKIQKGKGLIFNCEKQECGKIIMDELFSDN